MKYLFAIALACAASVSAQAYDNFSDGQDVTHLLANPQFDQQGGWQAVVNIGQTDGDKVRIDNENRLLEKWWGNMRVQQTIADIPNGRYRLEIQGFQWHCWDWKQGAEWWAAGNDQVTAKISLNNDEVSVQNLYSVGPTDIREGYYADVLGYYVPNDASTARKFFDVGLYQNTVETQVTNNRLNVALTMMDMSYWCCFANARLTYVGVGSDPDAPYVPTGSCSLTAAQTAAAMGVGINLGNTMEGGGGESQNFTNYGGLRSEISWQSTKTTQQVIDFIAAQGFKSIRIPCAWVMGHIADPSTYQIDEAWMARVKEIVNYCMKDGLYVVINDHWDGGWLESNTSMKAGGITKEKNKTVLRTIWTQIANEFRDYDHHLIFAGLNEPDAKTVFEINNLIEYEQVFIDAVRATGGNNAERVLVVQAPSTSHELACGEDYHMPADVVVDRLMLEVHYYNPWQFWGMEKDESWGNCFYYWGKDNHVPGSKHNPNWDCEEDNMRYWLEQLHDRYVVNGVPILFGEFGANWRNLTGKAGESQAKHNDSIHLYYRLLCQYSLELGMVPMAWDTNYPNYGMTIIDRKKLEVYNTIMMDAINQAIAAGIDDIVIDKPKHDTRVYDLMGRPVDPQRMAPGQIYIQNGRKYLTK